MTDMSKRSFEEMFALQKRERPLLLVRLDPDGSWCFWLEVDGVAAVDGADVDQMAALACDELERSLGRHLELVFSDGGGYPRDVAPRADEEVSDVSDPDHNYESARAIARSWNDGRVEDDPIPELLVAAVFVLLAIADRIDALNTIEVNR